MTIKAIMVDVDGVLIVHPDQRGWSANLERDVGIAASTLQTDFFAPHWDDIIHGRASLRERLGPALQKMNPDVTCDELIDYWFSHDAHLNYALLAELASFRGSGAKVHLATVQEHERADYLWEELGLRSQFDGLHYAAALGCSKPDASFYRAIERRTGFKPQELFFIDDKIANVESARACGWNAALWTGKASLRSLLPAEP
ncbi:MAG: HAD-IA family hydrolase [Candidatus Kaistia colombiensis]|nr:MAG: HAD-IA family hydrolase [Kaistia sp.]